MNASIEAALAVAFMFYLPAAWPADVATASAAIAESNQSVDVVALALGAGDVARRHGERGSFHRQFSSTDTPTATANLIS